MFKLTTPNDNTSRIGGPFDGLWIIRGVTYTNSAELAERMTHRGYSSAEVDEIPAEYSEQVARLEAWPHPITLGGADGADPDQQYRFTAPDGHTQLDVRDVISGALVMADTPSANRGTVPVLNGTPIA